MSFTKGTNQEHLIPIQGSTIPSSLKITKTHLQIYKSRYNIIMKPLLIYKALSNETRCQILSWLKIQKTISTKNLT